MIWFSCGYLKPNYCKQILQGFSQVLWHAMDGDYSKLQNLFPRLSSLQNDAQNDARTVVSECWILTQKSTIGSLEETAEWSKEKRESLGAAEPTCACPLTTKW